MAAAAAAAADAIDWELLLANRCQAAVLSTRSAVRAAAHAELLGLHLERLEVADGPAQHGRRVHLVAAGDDPP